MNHLFEIRKSLNDKIIQLDRLNQFRESINNFCDELRIKSMLKSRSCKNHLCLDCVNQYKCESQLVKHDFEMVNNVYADINVDVEENVEPIHLIVPNNNKGSIERIKKHQICHWPDCGKQFSKFSQLKIHQDIHSQNKKYKCSFCGHRFIQNGQLNRHVVAKHLKINKKRFKCQIDGCGKSFTLKSNLKSHSMVNRYNMKPVDCQNEDCKIKYKTISEWKAHLIEDDHNERAFKCDYENCSYSDVSQCNLKRHVNSIHLGIYRFKCDYEGCEKKYSTKNNLCYHVSSVHLNQRAFKCDYENCSYSSYSRCHLKSHVNSVHLRISAFKCDYKGCAKKFTSRFNLDAHVSSFHLNHKPFKCPKCPSKFVNLHRLNYHAKQCHKIIKA